MTLNLVQIRISIHASAKEATVDGITLALKGDFNPRLREGGDKKNGERA